MQQIVLEPPPILMSKYQICLISTIIGYNGQLTKLAIVNESELTRNRHQPDVAYLFSS